MAGRRPAPRMRQRNGRWRRRTLIILGAADRAGDGGGRGRGGGHVPILAFTSDRQQARPGVWTLGIEPEQQVERLVQVLAAHGKTRVVAVLPDNMRSATRWRRGLSPGGRRSCRSRRISIATRPGSSASLEQALRDATGYAQRRGDIEARAKAAQGCGRRRRDATNAAAIRAEPVPPPGFDALLLAESGPLLSATVQRAGQLTTSMVPEVQVVGPATWAREASQPAGPGGRLVCGPGPGGAGGFRPRLSPPATRRRPTPLADLAYDAARLARSAVTSAKPPDPAARLCGRGWAGGAAAGWPLAPRAGGVRRRAGRGADDRAGAVLRDRKLSRAG